MNEYKVEFKEGAAAGFPASNLVNAHSIAREYSTTSWYILYRKDNNEWVRVGDNYNGRV